MAASDYTYFDHELQQRGYWINEGATWVPVIESHARNSGPTV